MTVRSLHARLSTFIEESRIRLAHPDALLHLAVLGLFSGLAAGGVIILFRVAVEGTQGFMLPGGKAENYEALAWWWRLLLPIIGGLLIGVLFKRMAAGSYVLGVTKVLERMAYHQGRMGWRGFFLQFFGAAIAIIAGHSVGREGPHVYLGAAAGSLLGGRLGLPHNAIRTLVACGAAAAIAASFNTPLAGVIFSLEVVMMEYTLSSFIPVILAAVSATVLSNSVFGAKPAFDVALQMGSLGEIPLVLVLGLAVGGLSALFNQLVESTARRAKPLAFWWRTSLAGLVIGICGVLVPEVMGIGYDTVNDVLHGQLAMAGLLLILLFKLLATSAAIGLGVPGGMIGPVLFMGAMLGGIAGLAGEALLSGVESSPAFYALLGMGAMMGASLQAPLAALVTMLELTHNPTIVMPGMLAIVAASLVSSQVFGKESLFLAMLKANGMDYDTNPVLQLMRRIGVAGVMNRRFERLPTLVGREQAERALMSKPDWIVVDAEEGPRLVMPAVDLARYLSENQDQQIALSDIPAQRYLLTAVHDRATLQEAMEQLDRTGAEAVYVEQATVPGIRRIYGILTRGRIESAYKI
jgi:CIC family chloride channel protein